MDINPILNRISNGDRSAFALIVQRFQQPLFGYLGRLGLSQGMAEDIAQETFLRAWKQLNDFDPARAAFSTWLFTIARNLALHELERAANKYEVMGEDLPEPVDVSTQPAEILSKIQQRRRLQNALRSLPLPDRSALALAYFQELDLAAVAHIEGCS
ncbi:MAG: sigma-70 family RNA polymerase sigma factor, partial [Methylococcales bacterium]